MTSFPSLRSSTFHRSAHLHLVVMFVLAFSGLGQLAQSAVIASADQSASYTRELHLASGSAIDLSLIRRACERHPERSDSDTVFALASASLLDASFAFAVPFAAQVAALNFRHNTVHHSPHSPRAPPLA